MSKPNIKLILDDLEKFISNSSPQLLKEFKSKRHTPKLLFLWLEPLINSQYSKSDSLEEIMREFYFTIR